MAICWSIWIERNNGIFKGIEREAESLWDTLKYWVIFWLFDIRDFKEILFTDLIRNQNLWL